jgi:hypothetical protein
LFEKVAIVDWVPAFVVVARNVCGSLVRSVPLLSTGLVAVSSGAGGTTVSVPDPEASFSTPVHDSVYVVVTLGATVIVPFLIPPVENPVPVQLNAFSDHQVRVDEFPCVTLDGVRYTPAYVVESYPPPPPPSSAPPSIIAYPGSGA